MNRTFIYSLLAALLLCGAVPAAEPPAVGTTFETPIRLATPFDVTAPDGSTVRLILMPSQYADRAVLMDQQFRMWYLTPIEGPQPQPQPKPDPKPQPEPDPQPDRVAYVYLIHESGDSTPQTAAVRDAKPWKDAAEAAGIRWLVVDIDEALKAFPNAAAKAKEVGLPAVVRLDNRGVAVADKAPTTPEAMLELIKRYVPNNKGN